MNTTTRPSSPVNATAIKNFKTSSPFWSELSEDDRVTVARARKLERFLSQPFFVAEVFTGSPGKYVKLEETIKGFQMILSGQLDDLPEQAFYMVGNIERSPKPESSKAKG